MSRNEGITLGAVDLWTGCKFFYVKSLTGGVSCGLGHEASTVHVARPRTVLDIRKALHGTAQCSSMLLQCSSCERELRKDRFKVWFSAAIYGHKTSQVVEHVEHLGQAKIVLQRSDEVFLAHRHSRKIGRRCEFGKVPASGEGGRVGNPKSKVELHLRS